MIAKNAKARESLEDQLSDLENELDELNDEIDSLENDE